ncbi:MAG: amidohydrolase family protein, partial [Candidatus Heimdallarchaeota archaeon]
MMIETRIDAETVIVGDGEHYTNGSIVFKGNKITYTGESEHAPNVKNTHQTNTVMPGMWDCHTHFMGITTLSLDVIPSTNPVLGGIRTTKDAYEAIKSGFTSVREVGGHGVLLNQAIQEGIIHGPRIYGAGSILSTTGGHADIHSFPLEMVLELAEHNQHLGEMVDGVSGCLRGVRKQLRKGAEIIKFCASGGVMSFLDDPMHQQFSLEEQKTIVEEATRADRAVAAHCHGADGIRSALEAGVKTIEHGSYLNEDLAQLMIEKDAILVPTRLIVEKIITLAKASGIPDYALAKGMNLSENHKEAIKIAVKEGVTIAMGTDYGLSGLN